jgi:hypothetical protein
VGRPKRPWRPSQPWLLLGGLCVKLLEVLRHTMLTSGSDVNDCEMYSALCGSKGVYVKRVVWQGCCCEQTEEHEHTTLQASITLVMLTCHS